MSVMMSGDAVDHDRLERCGGADIFAGAASDAEVGVDRSHHDALAVAPSGAGHQFDGLAGTSLGAEAAADAVVGLHACVADDEDVLLVDCEGEESACGAHIRASGAVVAAVGGVEVHHRMEHVEPSELVG